MEIIHVTPSEAEDAVKRARANGEELCICSVADAPCAIVGNSGGSNETEARRLGILVVHMGNEGSTIVTNTGDVDIGIFTDGYSGDGIRDRLISLIAEEVKAQTGITMTLSGNDHMVDGKKVIGHGSRMFDGVLYTAIHIAIYTDLSLIRQICTKPMAKTPGALSNYGVTTDFVMRSLEKVIKEYEENKRR